MGTMANYLEQDNVIGSIASMDSIYKTNIVPKGDKLVRKFRQAAAPASTIKYPFKGQKLNLESRLDKERFFVRSIDMTGLGDIRL